jgi:hypothetical protein
MDKKLSACSCVFLVCFDVRSCVSVCLSMCIHKCMYACM